MAGGDDSVMWLRVKDEDIDAAELLRVKVRHHRERQEVQDFVRVHRNFAQGQRRLHAIVFTCAEEGEGGPEK